ncbi:alpha-(1,4)-fucosyltransferase [Cocos nucifera]|uniref:Fucosyltransferase n=1 Tax=Cocos nucifera TaxID=13894 RepID=A0A8K0NDA4_COCNU|nr:alpha-(1,4)-fucosyltransferase [Cocos nucifera]
MLPLKPINYLAPMLASAALLLLLLTGFLEFPSLSSPIPSSPSTISYSAVTDSVGSRPKEPFTDLAAAFARWDSAVGCARFRERYKGWTANVSAIQKVDGGDCTALGMDHVSVLVKGWTWIPDNMDNLYSCRCGMTCLWTKSKVLADKPDALLFENVMPPRRRRRGDPLRVYVDLEASRKPSGFEDVFVGYHAKDDVQSTYAGTLFHKNRNYHVSSEKRNDTLVYWSSSRCLPQRNQLARNFLSLVSHHSFGKCLNNVGGLDMALSVYPECSMDDNSAPHWWNHLHCAMSHYKFVLAIENTKTDSYVTEKLYYALDAGAVPIYFGAPNVWDFVPPNSIIDGSKFSSLEKLASYVKALADDPIAYAEYHAWRRCGVMGNYGKTRAASLDTLPCRLCEVISRKGGRNARTL